ncbi:MAG: hypothetical protein ACK55I_14780, partial [bacterium]
ADTVPVRFGALPGHGGLHKPIEGVVHERLALSPKLFAPAFQVPERIKLVPVVLHDCGFARVLGFQLREHPGPGIKRAGGHQAVPELLTDHAAFRVHLLHLPVAQLPGPDPA